MNIIPSTFNSRNLDWTVINKYDEAPKWALPVTAVVLCRENGSFRSRLLEQLISKGFKKIICIESSSEETPGIYEFAKSFESVEFIIIRDKNVTQADLMNIAFLEADTDHILVLQSEMYSNDLLFNRQLYERLSRMNCFCVVPRLFSQSREILPFVFSPDIEGNVFAVRTDFVPDSYGKTLYPADLAGFYDRKKYISLGGMDWTINSTYWQKLDLFVRSWLWGESVMCANGFDVSYSKDCVEEDHSADLYYLRFYLKNLLPAFVNDHGVIKKSSFFVFKSKCACGLPEALRQFRGAANWVKQNQFRFKKDIISLISEWDKK